MNITNEIISAYIDNLYVNENPKLEELREFAESRNVPIILKDTEKLLKVIMKLKEPARVLEIGTAVGYSSCVFADCCGCRVITIESDEESAKAARLNIESLGFSDLVEVVQGDARDILASLDKGEGFDILFIDAAKSHYREFLEQAEKICTGNAIVVCDNILLKGWIVQAEGPEAKRHRTNIKYMKQFLDYLKERDDLETTILTGGDGLAIIRFRNDK